MVQAYTGYYSKGRQIKVAIVQVTLSAIVISLMVEGYSFHNLLHNNSRKLILLLQYLIDAYRKEDPLVLPQLAVLLEVIKNMQKLLLPKGK